jgi:hypothetical protein
MATFDFVASDDLRTCLEKDAEELVRCMKAGAWKSAHVMAASLIQATLVEYLTTSGLATEPDLLRLAVPELLEFCRKEQVLTPRTVELAGFLRPHGDFLSADSRTRLEAATDETGARIAQALLEIVINEISGHKRETFHHTAEQVVAKIQSDPSSVAILGHLLRKISRAELERLLVDLLPNAYFKAGKSEEPQTPEMLTRIEVAFRQAFDAAPADLKRTVSGRLLHILENETEYVVQSYEGSFFRASDLQYLSPEGQAIVKAHFLASLSKQVTPALVTAASGIGEFLETEEESRACFVTVVVWLMGETGQGPAAAVSRRVTEEYARLSAENQVSIASWMGRLRWSIERAGRASAAQTISRLESSLPSMAG